MERKEMLNLKDLSLAIEEIQTYNTIAIRFHQFDKNNIIWNTDIVVNFNTHVFSIKIDRETTADTIGFIPQFKTPILVNMLLERGYIAMDNGLEISDRAIPIKKDNYKVIEDIICRNTIYSMPVIYVTKSWGRYPLRVQSLAYRLHGVAHTLVEEDTDVSKVLKESCHGMNSHHGSIGIYYPGSSALYKIITTGRYEKHEEILLDCIVNMVCRYMHQQARDKMMTWEGVQNELLKLRYVSATEKKAKAENEVLELYENFSDELEEKERTIKELNNRVIALQAENQGLRAKYEQVTEIPLIYYGVEDELYEGEIKDQILECNEITGAVDKKRKDIKRILKGYTKVGDSLKCDLKAYGFAIEKEGRHYKLIYKRDSRYLFTMAASGSDSQHGGGNLSAEIIRDML